jgi:hypothetical protein
VTRSIRRSLIGQRAGFMVTQGTANSYVVLEGFKVGLGFGEEKYRSLRRDSPEMDVEDNCQSIVSRHCVSLG